MRKLLIVLIIAIVAVTLSSAGCISASQDDNFSENVVEQIDVPTEHKYPLPMYVLKNYSDKIESNTLEEKNYEAKWYDLDFVRIREVSSDLPVLYTIKSQQFFDSHVGADVLDPMFDVSSVKNIKMSMLCSYALSLEDKKIYISDDVTVISIDKFEKDSFVEVYYEENGRHYTCGFVIELTPDSYQNLYENQFAKCGTSNNVEKITFTKSPVIIDGKYPMPMPLLNGYNEKIDELELKDAKFFVERYSVGFVNLEINKNRDIASFVFKSEDFIHVNQFNPVFHARWEFDGNIDKIQQYAFAGERHSFAVKPDFTIVERTNIAKNELVHIYYMKDNVAHAFGFVLELTADSYKELFEQQIIL